MEKYSVKQLSKLAGVSVRTLHVYDRIGLLKPLIRTEARYRYYGKEELLRLQQILFYKELGLPLKEISDILDDPVFDVLEALEDHKTSLKEKQDNISILIKTIDKTIYQLKKGKEMLKPEELYEGFHRGEAESFRKEASEKFGSSAVKQSEDYLLSLEKEDFEALKFKARKVFEDLFAARNEKPENENVQKLIAVHYNVIRQFWGTANSNDNQAESYSGLGDLYVADNRYTMINDQHQPEFADFLNKAMKYFCKQNLT